MTRRIRRIAAWTGAAVLLLAVLAVGAATAWVAASLPMHEGTVPVNGPGQEVTILRDARGVPHIFAGSEPDAYFALGYVHGQDRLWQMDFLRRLAAGRLSEVLGAERRNRPVLPAAGAAPTGGRPGGLDARPCPPGA